MQLAACRGVHNLVYGGHYKMETLNTAFLSGQMKRFFEIDIREFVNVGELLKNEAQKEQDMEEPEIPMFVQSALVDQEKITMDVLAEENAITNDDIYDLDAIDFEEINCAFMKVEGMNVFDAIIRTLQEVPKGVLAVKASPLYQPYTLKLLSAVGRAKTMEMLLCGRAMLAEEANACGLISRIVPLAELENEAFNTAAKIVQTPEFTAIALKETLKAFENPVYESAIDEAMMRARIIVGSDDFRNYLRKFSQNKA